MIRALDPLFPTHFLRAARDSRVFTFAPDGPVQAENAAKSNADRPRWDAPSHWIEPDRYW
ncbi:hypothetical protein [Mameliella sediminis]|uniref:hypothetical protein n=1 Tax=Mameliella sediminis TaxID=2836866 RepID=UPI001C46482E|nr:hypothetical protein [Mameliella sediminis]MBV7393911.1 hypothetical protein [Mameliella sediminis]